MDEQVRTHNTRVHPTFERLVLGLSFACIIAILVYWWLVIHAQWLLAVWSWLQYYAYTAIGLVALFYACRLGSKLYHLERTRALERATRDAERAYRLAQAKHVENEEEIERLKIERDHEYRMAQLALQYQHFTLPANNVLAVKQQDNSFVVISGPSPRPLLNQSSPVLNQDEPVLSFRDLLVNGTIQNAIAGGKMALGYVNGQLRYGSWLDLYSCGIGGVSGSGKTTTVRFLLFQAVLAGARLIMIDPHIGDESESLAAQFACFKNVHVHPPCDESPAQVEKRVNWLDREYKRRMHNGIKGPALILVVDELNAAMRRMPDELKKKFSDLLLTIAQEGRKFGIFAMLIGQRWSEQDLGGKPWGAAIRASLSSSLAHRFKDEGQAKLFAGSRYGVKTLELKQGSYFFTDTQGDTELTVTPLTTSEDGAYIQSLLDERTPETTQKSVLSMPDLPRKDALYLPSFQAERTLESASESTLVEIPTLGERNQDEQGSPERGTMHTLAMSVVLLAAQGTSKNDIMRQLWHVNPGGSSEYKAANEQYQLIMQYIANTLER